MGWKAVKEHYRIGHIVHVRGGNLCIGSPYISEIIVIAPDGMLKKRYERNYSNKDLARYQAEFDADPAKLRELMQVPDTFSKSIPVYTYDGGSVIEKQCEELGWPNITHDGDLMYENTFSPDKAKVVHWAKRNARAGVRTLGETIVELQREYAKECTNLAALEKEFPPERRAFEFDLGNTHVKAVVERDSPGDEWRVFEASGIGPGGEEMDSVRAIAVIDEAVLERAAKLT